MARSSDKPAGAPAYTCREYRGEMLLLGLRRRLSLGDLTEAERAELTERVRRLEAEMGMD